MAAGPLGHDKFRGLSILRVPPDEARALKEADPAVQAGRFDVVVVPWQVPAGAAALLAHRFPHSIADVMGISTAARTPAARSRPWPGTPRPTGSARGRTRSSMSEESRTYGAANWYSVSRSSRSRGTTAPPTDSSTCGIDFTLPMVRPTDAATSCEHLGLGLGGVGRRVPDPAPRGRLAGDQDQRAGHVADVGERVRLVGAPEDPDGLALQRGRRDPGDVARRGRDPRSHVVRAAHLDRLDPARVVPPLRLGPHPAADQRLLGGRGVRQALDHRRRRRGRRGTARPR